MHIFSIANVLSSLGIHCAVCVPNDPDTIRSHGVAHFEVVPYIQAAEGVCFPDGKGPSLIHAWTPRELVRKLTERLARIYSCPYLVHLEDNEEVILESECPGYNYAQLEKLPADELERFVPEHRSHPLRYKDFLNGAAGVTALMDRLLEFKPSHVPSLVFWPGFDEQFRDPVAPAGDPPWCHLLDAQNILVYTGNIHDTNASEVRSLFLAVRALKRAGVSIRLLKTGWNHVQDRGWIQEAIESGAVADLGFVARADLPALLSAATLLVQPGRTGSFNDYRFPSKLPEFLVSGKPVILPKTNLGRFLRDGTDAVLLQEGNAIEIAGKIEAVLEDAELAARIGRNGRKFALRKLAWEHNVPPIKAFYESVLTRSNEAMAPAPAADARASHRLIAFYLPQFHPIPENDQNWGKGFTEWTSVTQARPNFLGHHQPQLPADLGFYDLRLPETMEHQAALARQYGIHGFCYYYYWFNGRRVLERPVEQMLRSGRPNFPFCLCWANENWTRNWDGSADELLIAQDYSGAGERFIRDVLPYLKDHRYIRVNDAPMLLVYRVSQLPDPIRTVQVWRDVCAREGVGEIHLCAVQSFGVGDPRPYGFDAAVEFPPHTQRALIDPHSFPGVAAEFEGYLEDYPAIVENQLARPWPDYRWYRGVMPAWDNTARRGTRAHILVNSSPELYEHWLGTLVEQTRQMEPVQPPVLFVNAWNEWAEGAYLEPDQKLGHARLRATSRALGVERAISGRSGIEKEPIKRMSQQSRASATGSISPPQRVSSIDPQMEIIVRRYQSYGTEPLSYGTVRDFCDSFDHLNDLATRNGDLKDLQRPWILKAVLAKVPRPGRVLEIGAGEPFVADLLSRMGHEAWIVDPYDGSGNGPVQYEEFRQRYPHLHFVKSQFHDLLENVPAGAFDCIYSISVLEHVPADGMPGVFRGLRRFLKPSGVSIHAVDHVHRGNGAVEHLTNLRLMAEGFGFSQTSLEGILKRLTEDTETYYLSAESHNRWRGGMSYDEFPMRVCPSIHFISSAEQIREI
jgi:glycosyltransferase involved in cell wall biosynthesis/2-polyprenyl-3-methyl-5-hydroxy-6-metoxy-1,4-benzoquinol methylase